MRIILALGLVLSISGCSFARTDRLIDPTTPTGSFKVVSLQPVKQFVGKLRMPVPAAKSTSKFGWREGKFHEGIDLGAPEGSDILAAHDGEVVMVRNSFSRYGKVVVVQNGRMLSVYAHNRKNIVDVGDKVEAGSRIAELGATGNATGPHLHFETRVKSGDGRYVAVDPAVFLQKKHG